MFMLKTFPFGLKNGVAFGFKSLLFKTVLVEPDIMLEFESLLNEWDEDEKGTAFGFKLLPFWIMLEISHGHVLLNCLFNFERQFALLILMNF